MNKAKSVINYEIGDATDLPYWGKHILVHCCNDIGAWGAGFVLAVSRRWKDPEKKYRRWYKETKNGDSPSPLELGKIQLVDVTKRGIIFDRNLPSRVWVANLIGQKGIGRGLRKPIRYSAVKEGLEKVALFAKRHNATVHMPRIGCGLAGGNWEDMAVIIEEVFADTGLRVIVHDLA